MGLAAGDTLAATQVIHKPELNVVGMVGAKENHVKLTGGLAGVFWGESERREEFADEDYAGEDRIKYIQH